MEVGCGRYEQEEERRGQRHGFYFRDLVSQVGTLRLRVVRTREKSSLPAAWNGFSAGRHMWDFRCGAQRRDSQVRGRFSVTACAALEADLEDPLAPIADFLGGLPPIFAHRESSSFEWFLALASPPNCAHSLRCARFIFAIRARPPSLPSATAWGLLMPIILHNVM